MVAQWIKYSLSDGWMPIECANLENNNVSAR